MAQFTTDDIIPYLNQKLPGFEPHRYMRPDPEDDE